MLRVLVLSASVAAAMATASVAAFREDDGYGSVRHHEVSSPHAHYPRRDENRDAEHNDRKTKHSNRRHWWSHDSHDEKREDDSDDDNDYHHSSHRKPSDHHDHDDHDDHGPRGRYDDQFSSARHIRQDTERFVSGLLDWVNELVTLEAAATFVVDTTFSLAKTQGASLQDGSGGSSGIRELFPVIQKFVNNPQEVDPLEDDVQAIEWAPVVAKGTETEVEGGIYAVFHIACEQRVLLNVSISSSGSTPTIQGQRVENSGLLIDVNILEGVIQVTEAQGSIIGFIRRRHFPENADDVLKNWTAALQSCAVAKTLAVKGAVGGGWTRYRPDDNGEPGNFTSSSVGYTEAFEFKFPGHDEVAATVQDTPSGVLRANAIRSSGPATSGEPLSGKARAAAFAYLQANGECGQRSPEHSISCAGFTVMSQLQSVHHFSSSSARTTLAPVSQLHASHFHALPTTPLLGIVGFVALLATAAMITLRRRSGYHGIVNEEK